ncbi:MAG: hypothetical protein AAGJ40_02045 [Planctomycetota bacterium]
MLRQDDEHDGVTAPFDLRAIRRVNVGFTSSTRNAMSVFMFSSTLRQTTLVGLFLAMTVSTASADWNGFLTTLHKGFFRNTAWPDPFNEVDAIQVVAPFEAMKRNGWRSHNTIGHALFRTGDGALLASGQNRVRWIATQSPENHREIYVLQGANPVETEARVQSVRDAVAALPTNGTSPQIYVTAIEAPTVPGAIVTKISRDRMEQMVPPKLPTTTASGTSGVSGQ